MKSLEYKIKQVGFDIITDYDGMNYYAAKQIGFDSKIKPNEVLINKDLTFIEKIHTIIHEIAEAEKMKQGWNYWQAHKHAEKMEAINRNIVNMIHYIAKKGWTYALCGAGSNE
jgi:dimeric dUTPase (all-alpha-NTP-PPase superfamily)